MFSCDVQYELQKCILYSSEGVANGFRCKGCTSISSSKVGERLGTVIPPLPIEVNVELWWWCGEERFSYVFFVWLLSFFNGRVFLFRISSGFKSRGELLRTVAFQ